MSKNIGAKPIDLRRQNYQSIIQLFRNHPTLAVRDIAQVLSLSKTAITNILNNLTEMNIIHAVGKGESTNQGGKKPEMYALNSDYGYVITAYFSHEFCLCQLYDMNYNVLGEAMESCTVQEGYPYEEVLSILARQISSVMEQNNLDERRLCGIVFQCAGIILHKEGILSRPILSPQWGNELHVIEDIRARLRISAPLYLNNTSRFHGCYELLECPERRNKNIITLFCSSTVGGSQLRMGHLIHGLTGLVGEYGHLTTDYTFSERCNCGNYGCFETSVSREPVLRRICRDLKTHAVSSLSRGDLSTLTIQEVFQAANDGDSLARKHLDYVIQQFTVLIYNMQITYDPDEIIIQGIYANSGSYFQKSLEENINHLSLHNIQNRMKLTFSFSYGTSSYPDQLDFAMKGAAFFCFDQYFKDLEFTV